MVKCFPFQLKVKKMFTWQPRKWTVKHLRIYHSKLTKANFISSLISKIKKYLYLNVKIFFYNSFAAKKCLIFLILLCNVENVIYNKLLKTIAVNPYHLKYCLIY